MNYNEWKRDNPKGTPRQYVEYCRKNGLRPNLRGANMTGADLHGANLHGADMTGADLRGANLRGADMSRAVLHGANLHGADMSRANMTGADLHGANLHGADMSRADLSRADLRVADLRVADLRGANMSGADLTGAHGDFTIGYFGQHHALAAGGYISIGCERHTYDDWLENYDAIGIKHEHTDDERADYGAWIKLAVARQRRLEEAETP